MSKYSSLLWLTLPKKWYQPFSSCSIFTNTSYMHEMYRVICYNHVIRYIAAIFFYFLSRFFTFSSISCVFFSSTHIFEQAFPTLGDVWIINAKCAEVTENFFFVPGLAVYANPFWKIYKLLKVLFRRSVEKVILSRKRFLKLIYNSNRHTYFMYIRLFASSAPCGISR